jgi:hypothetical protein
MRNVWQNQEQEDIRMSVDEIRSRAGKFQKKIYWRNAREYITGLGVVLFFGFKFWQTADALARAEFRLIITGIL